LIFLVSFIPAPAGAERSVMDMDSKHVFRVQSVKVFEVVVRGQHSIEDAKCEAEAFIREATDTGMLGTISTRFDLNDPDEKTHQRGQYVEEVILEDRTSRSHTGSECISWHPDEDSESDEVVFKSKEL